MSQRKLKKLRKQKELPILSSSETVCLTDGKGFSKIIRQNWKFLLIIIIGTILLYVNGLRGDFVSDDYATIPQNPIVANLGQSLKTTPNLVNLSNTVIAMIFGIKSSAPYHIYNLMIFLIDEILMFVFVYLLMGRSLAMLSTAMFAVHPIHVEAVTWISGRPYSLFALFTLIILICIILFLINKKIKYIVTATICTFLAYKTDGARTLSLAFILPLCLTYTISLTRIKINWAKFLGVGCLVTVLVAIVLWPAIIGRIRVVNSGYNMSESIFYNPFFQYPTAVTKYLQLLVVPIDLTLYHTMYTLPVWLNWVVFVTYMGTVIYSLFRDRRISFALAFIFIGAAASMAPVKVAWLVAERYMFLGSLGFCIFLSIIIFKLWKINRYISVAVLSVLLTCWSIRTVLRNIDWNTNHNLWVNTCQVSPNSHNAWNNIGDDYDKLKDYDNAIKGFTQSTVVKPNYADAYHNRANIFFKIGRLDLARDSYNTALYYSPALYQTYISLTQIDLIEKNFVLAEQHAKKTMEYQPNNPQAGYVLAVVYAQMGKKNESKSVLEAILRSYPDYKLAKDLLVQLNSL
jgi:hypothetical protein